MSHLLIHNVVSWCAYGPLLHLWIWGSDWLIRRVGPGPLWVWRQHGHSRAQGLELEEHLDASFVFVPMKTSVHRGEECVIALSIAIGESERAEAFVNGAPMWATGCDKCVWALMYTATHPSSHHCCCLFSSLEMRFPRRPHGGSRALRESRQVSHDLAMDSTEGVGL